VNVQCINTLHQDGKQATIAPPDLSQSISSLCYIPNHAKMINSCGGGVAASSSRLTRSMKHMRRRQLVPTCNASTPFTRPEAHNNDSTRFEP
jgi:hypothetical protein